MPKQVDHEERRRSLARTAAGIIAARGLEALTFRELAAEAGVSVALVQHYFGTKAALLVHTSLDRQSDDIGTRVADRLAELGPDAVPGARILALAEAFLPTDDRSRDAMIVYLSFAAGALTDECLRTAGAFSRGEQLRAYIAAELSTAADEHHPEPAAATSQATTILALILGMSLVALLPGNAEGDLLDPVRRHLTSIGLPPGEG